MQESSRLVEEGREAGFVAEDSPSVARRFGKRAAVVAAVLIGAALASAAAVTLHERRAGSGAASAAVRGAAVKLFGCSDCGQYYGGGNTEVVVHHNYEPQQQVVVHHHYDAAPAYAYQQSGTAFVPEVQHDALPVYRGDAYHASYHADAGYSAYGSYHTHYYSARSNHATMWWIVLFVILLVLAGVGIYYFCFKK